MADDQRSLSIIVPFYNEKDSLEKLLPEWERRLAAWPHPWELLLVDDGSVDGIRLNPMAATVRVLRHPVYLGNGAAVKTGIRAATHDCCVILDADGQHSLDEALDLAGELDVYHLVVGARDFQRSGDWHRSFANRLYARFASFMAQFEIADLTSGIRAFRKKQVLEIIHLFPNGFSLPTTMTMGLIKLGYSVKFKPIHVKVREGSSKLNIWSDGTRFFLIIIKIATLFSPLRIFFPISAGMFLLGLLNYFFVLLDAHRFSLWSLVLLTNSITIFMMGLVAEEISSMKLKKES